MKVIFLDIDGVLINEDACRRGFQVVAPECVAVLNDLITSTGAVIVVSSCWRIGREVIELRDLLKEWGVIGIVLDRTPHLVGKVGEIYVSEIRGAEIQNWLDERRKHRDDVEKFVIIDDDSDMGDLLPLLVKTTFKHGLRPEEAQRALEILR